MTLNKKNLKFILKSTGSTIDDGIKWVRLIKRKASNERYPCNEGYEYLKKYSFYSPIHSKNYIIKYKFTNFFDMFLLNIR